MSKFIVHFREVTFYNVIVDAPNEKAARLWSDYTGAWWLDTNCGPSDDSQGLAVTSIEKIKINSENLVKEYKVEVKVDNDGKIKE